MLYDVYSRGESEGKVISQVPATTSVTANAACAAMDAGKLSYQSFRFRGTNVSGATLSNMAVDLQQIQRLRMRTMLARPRADGVLRPRAGIAYC